MDIIDVLLAKSLAGQEDEQAANDKVSKSGDTMTGKLTVENTVEADNVDTEKLTVTAATSTETTKVEPLKVRDDRVDILKTTVTQEDGTTKAESVIKAYKSDDGDVVDIHANMEIDGDIDYTGDININGTLDMRHDGRSSLFADHVKVDGSFQMNCFQIRGASDNYGDFDVIISRIGDNGAINSIAFDEYGNIEIGSETKNGQVRVGSNYTKVRATEGLSLEGNVADDVWKLCGDLKFIDPQLHCALPDDVTEEETTWLGNTTLQKQVLELKRTDKTIEDSITELQTSKQDKPTISTAAGTTATIYPDIIYEYGEVAELNLSLVDATGNYEVIFESGETATVLSLTSTKSLLWHNEPVVLPNKIYVLSVEVGTTYARAVLSYAESVS